MCPPVHRCCCCTVRTTSLITGIFGIVFGALGFLLSLVVFIMSIPSGSDLSTLGGQEYYTQSEYEDAKSTVMKLLVLVVSVVIILNSLVELIMGIILVCGVLMKSWRLVLTWVILELIILIGLVIFWPFTIIIGVFDMSSILSVVIYGSLMFPVYSYYRELRDDDP